MPLVSILIKYYPLVFEALTKAIPLLKGDKSKENMEYLEETLKKLEAGVKDAEKQILKREKEITFFRWMALVSIFLAFLNSIVLVFMLSKYLNQ